MKKTIVNLFFAALIIIGLAMVAFETKRNWGLRAEHKVLVNEFGEFSIPDPSKVYIVALPSKRPMHFSLASPYSRQL